MPGGGWRDDLAGCFDSLDRLFALHAMNEERAFRLLERLREEQVGWRTLSDAVRELLESDGCEVRHIELQLQQVELRFRPWLAEAGAAPRLRGGGS